MITTRIVRIGNSKGIIIPTMVVKALALTEGDTVSLHYDDKTQQLTVSFPATKQLLLTSSLHNS